MDSDERVEHIVLCGLNGLGLRTLEELYQLGEAVTVIARAPEAEFAAGARRLGVPLIDGSYRDEETLRAAGIVRACAMVIVEDDDVGNLHAALAAQELNPRLRIVLRMFDLELGDQLVALFRDCAVLSAAAIAAPALVSAALHQDWAGRIVIAGRVLTVRRGPAPGGTVLLPLAHLRRDGALDLFPADTAEDSGDTLTLVDSGPVPRDGEYPIPSARCPLSALARLRADRGRGDIRLRALLAILAGLIAFSTLIFWRFAGLSLIDALYFTATIVTTTGFGDINLRDAPPALKLYGVLLMLGGATALAIFYALVTDAIVGARLASTLGAPDRHLRDHVVVCGLGNVGYRVVEQLVRQGVPVAAIELREDNPFLSAIRRLGVPVLVADARLHDTLRQARVGEARCLIIATNNDTANLATALNATALNRDLRIVLRLFDPDLARRIERAFGIGLSRSVSALAAPAFATAAIGRQVVATIPVGARTLLVARTTIESGSWAAGRTVAELEAVAEVRVLLLADDRPAWCPAPDTPLAPARDLLLFATRSGLATILPLTEATPQAPCSA